MFPVGYIYSTSIKQKGKEKELRVQIHELRAQNH